MKKFITVLSLLLVVGLLVSCGGDKPKKKKKNSHATQVKNDATSSDDETMEDAPQTDPVPPEQLKKAKELIAAASDEDIAAIDGKKKFKIFCTACHGTNGKLKINGAKDLTKSKISLEESVAQIYFGKGLMTPFKGVLKDAEIVAVAKYIEELR